MKPKPLLYLPLREDLPPAPWSPTPLLSVREFVRENPDAQISIVFPEVFEEDRTAKLRDLGTAHELKIITHKRMSEQGAKELDVEQYDYEQELEDIQKEQDNPLLAPPSMGAGDAMAGAMGGGQPAGGSPAFGASPTATPEGARQPSDTAQPKRQDLSGDSTARFRRQQRTGESR